RQLADAETAHRDATEQHQSEMAAAETRLAQAAETRATLEHQLANAEAAHKQDQERHASELTAAAAQLAEQHADHEAQIAQAGAANEALEHQLRDATAALEQARNDRAADIERHQSELKTAGDYLAECQAEYDERLTQMTASRDTFEQQLRDTSAA